MESADVGGAGEVGTIDLHAAVEGVMDDEIVGHADAVGLHRMALAIVVIANCGFVEVGYPSLLCVCA